MKKSDGFEMSARVDWEIRGIMREQENEKLYEKKGLVFKPMEQKKRLKVNMFGAWAAKSQRWYQR